MHACSQPAVTMTKLINCVTTEAIHRELDCKSISNIIGYYGKSTRRASHPLASSVAKTLNMMQLTCMSQKKQLKSYKKDIVSCDLSK